MHKMSLPDFLKWAFGEELAHVPGYDRIGEGGGNFGSAWGGIAEIAKLGCFVDGTRTPVDQMAPRMIDPDAVAASEAVMLLAAENFDIPARWNPFPELDDPYGLIADCVREVVSRRALAYAGDRNGNLMGLIIACASMGKEPEWRIPQPKFRMVAKNGVPAWFVTTRQADVFGRVYEVETSGFDARSRRPMPGAYRKFEFSSPFTSHVQARIDWYLWTLAMERLAERLGEGLISHRILPFQVLREPWLFSSNFADTAQVTEYAAE